jgi:hypothetical protein
MQSAKKKEEEVAPKLTMVPPPQDADAALKAVLLEVEQIARKGSPHVNVEVQVVVRKIKAVLADVRSDAMLYEALKSLASARLFDFKCVNRLGTNVSALWLAGHHAKREKEQSERAVPEETAKEATHIREELTRTMRYHFGRDPVEGPSVNAIQNSVDYLELTNDLRYLHELSVRFHERLSRDAMYDTKMAARAKHLCEEIMGALDHTAVDEIRWIDRVAALWSLVKADYNELKNVGRFVLRATPDEAERRFPSLVKGPTRSKRATDAHEPRTPTNDNTTPRGALPAQDVAAPTDTMPAEGVPVSVKSAGRKMKRSRR